MDQKKVGQFLKTLRKEKNITQEVLAETLNVSSRTVSRWETGSNMPDISLLVGLSEFYQVSIPEIIDGERKSEEMNQETKNTAIKMAEYSKNELGIEKRKMISAVFMIFGVFIIISALAIFPNESSWGSIYAIIGGVVLTIGIYLTIKSVLIKRSLRILSVVGCVIVLFGIFTVTDYIAVSQFHQVPRFSYEKSFGEDIVEHKTLFYTVIQKNPGTANESIEIAK
ncbi:MULTISPECIES: helix-turn-helix domain-containing protein [Sellimonas]|uniref:Helix-turn-helix domain-containing protein n=1 Tax=Sellimonas caecigallum TaxID=2592333 RepID=A0ABS7L7I3_9FIRM|nr:MULTISPECIES: helix-turn-helix transcriptional regulator [Sellimonas]MBY0758913.1 helix-turn-helix domain-containing protein [Sellimonas caecigallum]OUP66232.1 transcriptional regulator [Drancourtella sp. An177]